MSTEEFDRKFDDGEDISEYIDEKNTVFRINIDIPIWAVNELDAEATRRGITRQSLIKTWLVDLLDERKKTADRKRTAMV
ncbi:MAG: CopG family transcriptional regulator [Nitrospinae bacterium]|nr:CopG family transcriptional regulator [Nitrospinota bacterium]